MRRNLNPLKTVLARLLGGHFFHMRTWRFPDLQNPFTFTNASNSQSCQYFLPHAFSARLQFETELNKRSETINQLALELSRAQDNLSLTEKDCADLMFAAKSRERALENQYCDLIGQMEAMRQRVCECGKKIFVYDNTDPV